MKVNLAIIFTVPGKVVVQSTKVFITENLVIRLSVQVRKYNNCIIAMNTVDFSVHVRNVC